MRQDLTGKTLSWGFGCLLPVWLALMGLVSLTSQQSAIPFSRGFGRFGFAATEAAGARAAWMGVAYLAFAALLLGAVFHPLRQRWPDIATWLQIVGFVAAFVTFGYVLLFSRG